MSGVVAGVLGVVHANSMRMAALSTTFELALLKRVKNSSFGGCIRRPTGDRLGRRHLSTCRAAAS